MMYYRLLADFLVATHFLWILFMLTGFGLILAGMLFSKKILNWFWFRTLHLAGIVYAGALSLQGKLCPLTIWENQLRARTDPSSTYSGSFIIHYIEKLVYPDVNPVLLQVVTVSLGVFTLLAYILKPPFRLKEILKKPSN
jgi:hypothetical protein